MATTLSAQSVISTTETTFEAFLVDNFVFIDFNECFTWMQHVLSEDYKVDEWVERITLDECVERVSSKVLGVTEEQHDIIRNYLSSFTEDDWTRVYYKNNLIEFTRRHQKIKELHDDIFNHINSSYEEIPLDKKGNIIREEDILKIPEEMRDEFLSDDYPGKKWNKFVSVQKFYDPNKIPDTVKEYLSELSGIYMKYVYTQFLVLDKIYRLRNFNREVVTVIDTDSNILSLDTWMNFCKEELMTSDYGRSDIDNVFIAINTITYVITDVVTDILLYYGECSNVEESHRGRYAMKNEFFFIKLIIAKTKKRYLSKVLLREGNRLTKPKYDVKGLTNIFNVIFKRPSTKKLVLANRVNCWDFLKLTCL